MLTEADLLEAGFTQHLMLGTGFLTISSMRPAQYYYTSPNGRIAVNCTHFWTWFFDGEQDNRIAVHNKEKLIELINLTSRQDATERTDNKA